jgi:acyl dehydratase
MWFEDIPLGGKITIGSYTFTEENIIAFGRAYDPQLFHVDAEAAKKSVYGGLIASGWHTAAVWMKLTIAHRRAEIAAGQQKTQNNYISPGVLDLKWHKPVRPGTTLIYTTEPFNKLDWKSRPTLGLLQSRNEARDEKDVLYYSFISQVLLARRPIP